MNEQNYTSLELSKKLKENGCKLESEYVYCGGHIYYEQHEDGEFEDFQECDNTDILDPADWYCHAAGMNCEYPIPAYDILNDICVEYAKEFFGRGIVESEHIPAIMPLSPAQYIFHPQQILYLLQHGKKQKAEDYIWEHCLFNPVNTQPNDNKEEKLERRV